jgi:hypothetical protein
MSRKADPNRIIRYPLSWPAWMADQVAEAANARAMSMATWLREAALEKLERDGSGTPAPSPVGVLGPARKAQRAPHQQKGGTDGRVPKSDM